MGFSDSISALSRRMMPTLALLKHDLRSLAASWLVRLWLVFSVLLALLCLAVCWGAVPTARAIAVQLLFFLVGPWSLVAIVLGVSPVTGARAEAVADGILSRPVTRYEFMVASWIARVTVVLGVCFVVTAPAILLLATAERARVPQETVTLYGVLGSLLVVALVLTFLVSLAFFMGTLLRGTTVAIVVLVLVWYPAMFVFDEFSLEEFSPLTLNRSIPTLLARPWHKPEGERAGVSREDLRSLERQRQLALSVLSGTMPVEPKNSPFFDKHNFDDFSLLRVTLGYGIPALLAIGLATLLFCRRDL